MPGKVKVGEAKIIVISKIFLTFPQEPVPTPLRGCCLRQMVVVRLSVWWLGVRGLAAVTLADGVRAGRFSSPCWGEDWVRMGMAGAGPRGRGPRARVEVRGPGSLGEGVVFFFSIYGSALEADHVKFRSWFYCLSRVAWEKSPNLTLSN